MNSRSRGQASTIGGVFLAVLIVMLVSYIHMTLNYITNYNIEMSQWVNVANERIREDLVIISIEVGNEVSLELDDVNSYGADYSPKGIGSIRNRLANIDQRSLDISDSGNYSCSINFEFKYSLAGQALNGNVSIYLSATGMDGYEDTGPTDAIEVEVMIYAFNFETNSWDLLKKCIVFSSEFKWYNCTLTREHLSGDSVRIMIMVIGRSEKALRVEKRWFFITYVSDVYWPLVWLSVSVDYMNVKVKYFDGILPTIKVKNVGACSSRIVDIWLINETHHVHFPTNITIPSGTEISIDMNKLGEAEVNGVTKRDAGEIKLTYNSRYVIKLVTVRGNIFTYVLQIS
ncbi:MAG: hypothetical protein DRZ82_03820 [Thermoprotei archaeon]|nr:MAG: hypothetical protein DRZ82_03820 [Thermoprotei archaeon]